MPRIRLSDQIMRDLTGEADRNGRTVEDQLAHWVWLGRVIERSGFFSHLELTDLLDGDHRTDPGANPGHRPSDQRDVAPFTP